MLWKYVKKSPRNFHQSLKTSPIELAIGVEVVLLATDALGTVVLTTTLATFRPQARERDQV